MEEVFTAVREEIELVEAGEKSAKDALTYLLRTYKALRRDNHGSTGKHVLAPLVEPFVRETLAS